MEDSGPQKHGKKFTKNSKRANKSSSSSSKKKTPLKVVYISNPMKVQTSASQFRALVQELTGRDAVDQWPPEAGHNDYSHDQTAAILSNGTNLKNSDYDEDDEFLYEEGENGMQGRLVGNGINSGVPNCQMQGSSLSSSDLYFGQSADAVLNDGNYYAVEEQQQQQQMTFDGYGNLNLISRRSSSDSDYVPDQGFGGGNW